MVPNDNLSWNCGAEGPTDDEAIRSLRERQKRNLIVTLLVSQGVPMLLSGDELCHSQGGNNNAYCQDNEITWLNWNLSDEQKAFLEFVRRVIYLRQQHVVLRQHRFFLGRPIRGLGVKRRLARSLRRGDDRRQLERRVRPLPGHDAVR